MMETLTVRFSPEDLTNINAYAEQKKVPISLAIGELVQLGLQLDNLKNNSVKGNNNDEEALKKLTLEHATASIEARYLLRNIVNFIMGETPKNSPKEVIDHSLITAKTFVKTTMGLMNND